MSVPYAELSHSSSHSSTAALSSAAAAASIPHRWGSVERLTNRHLLDTNKIAETSYAIFGESLGALDYMTPPRRDSFSHVSYSSRESLDSITANQMSSESLKSSPSLPTSDPVAIVATRGSRSDPNITRALLTLPFRRLVSEDIRLIGSVVRRAARLESPHP